MIHGNTWSLTVACTAAEVEQKDEIFSHKSTWLHLELKWETIVVRSASVNKSDWQVCISAHNEVEQKQDNDGDDNETQWLLWASRGQQITSTGSHNFQQTRKNRSYSDETNDKDTVIAFRVAHKPARISFRLKNQSHKTKVSACVAAQEWFLQTCPVKNWRQFKTFKPHSSLVWEQSQKFV